MGTAVFMPRWFEQSVRATQQWVREWWRLAYLSSVILVLGLSMSNYSHTLRKSIANHTYRNTAPILLGFTVVCALVSVVLTRIVLVTAMSYGLSQYALQVVIRVLVLEIIPLTAALFVALRCTIPDSAEIVALRAQQAMGDGSVEDVASIQSEVMPRVIAGLLCGITLAALSSVVASLVAYLASFGFSVFGFATYTRMFGQIFSPAVSLIFILKTLIFCLTVSLIPMASALVDSGGVSGRTARTSAEMRGLVRMFTLVLFFEVASLIGNYY
jgi:phospholipid/cholesterol/gamma-HCH transport system permease protein